MKEIIRRLCVIAAFAMACGVTTFASETPLRDSVTSISYRPNFHGSLRGRLEVGAPSGDYRFQLRNARVSLDGRIAPFIDYFLNADLCDCGTMKFLDGWVRLGIVKGLRFKGGQFRMPFGVETFRAPHTYYFSNRSFIAKEMCNYRAVGGEVEYQMSNEPLTFTVGAFSPTRIGDHRAWNKSVALAGNVKWKSNGWTVSGGWMSVEPDSARCNMVDAAVEYKSGRWTAAAEYIGRMYASDRHKPTHGYVTFASYCMPIKLGWLNQASFHARFDGMTACSNLTRNALGKLNSNYAPRNRVTVGASVAYLRTANIFAELRADYEQYFYHSGYTPSVSDGNKMVVELILRF